MQANAHRAVRIHVAATAATEHLTAVFAEFMLLHPQVLAAAPQRLQDLWMWHSAEESEHRNTAFDMYTAMGGSHEWRIRIFKYVTLTFLSDVLRQTVRNLWHDGSLFKWSTWRSAWVFLFAKQGLFRSSYAMWRRYFRPDFHPQQDDDSLSRQWLQDHQNDYIPVGPSH